MDNAPGQIYALIPKIMADVGAIGKTKTADMGKGGKYSFRGIDDVYNAVQPALVNHSVTVAPVAMEMIHREEREKVWDGKPTGTVLIYTVVRVTYRFFAPDGSYLECVAIGEAMDSGDKCMNKAMSAAMKYALFQTLCIPTEEPKDSENDHHEPAPRRQPPAAKPTPPAPNPYAKTFMDLLEKAMDSRNLGAGTAAATTRAMASLKKNYSMDSNTVTPEVGGKLIAAINDGKFDPKPAKQQEAA